MTSEHYFSSTPSGPLQRRTIDVELAGQVHALSSAPGVFSADHLDSATKVLLDAVPAPPRRGDLLDLGCGWGPIALTMALRSPHAQITAVDVNERALELTRENAAQLGLANVTAVHPEDVPVPAVFDLIWSNPPIRIGKSALHDLLRHWLGRLRPTGRAYLVVSKNLGADSLARWLEADLGSEVERITSSKGFRVLAVGRPGSAQPATTP